MNFGDFSSSREQPAHLKDITFFELGLRPRLAAQSSSLLRAVLHVVGLRPKKQVVGPHARSAVAFVAHKEFVREITKMKPVGKAVRLAVHLGSIWKRLPALPVAVRSFRSGPHPAVSKLGFVFRDRAVLIHLSPESPNLNLNHTTKTPITSKVNPAWKSGNRDDGREKSGYPFFSAGSMPIAV